MRAATFGVNPHGMLSRGMAGIADRTLIVNLSGSPKAVREQWEALQPVIHHAIDTVRGEGAHPERGCHDERNPRQERPLQIKACQVGRIEFGNQEN